MLKTSIKQYYFKNIFDLYTNMFKKSNKYIKNNYSTQLLKNNIRVIKTCFKQMLTTIIKQNDVNNISVVYTNIFKT